MDLTLPDNPASSIEARHDWNAVLEAYLSQKDVGSRESLKTYRKALRQFFLWTESTGRRLSGLTRVDIVAFRRHLEEERYLSPLTVSLYVAALRGFYAWAEEEGLCRDIARGLRVRHATGHVKRHLTRTERSQLVAFLSSLSLRDGAMANLMLRCGLRSIEVSRANVSDIQFIDSRRVLMIQGKGHKSKDRWVVLRDAAWEPLRLYLDSRGPVGPAAPLFACEGKGSRGRRLSARRVQDIIKRGLRCIGLDSHLYSAHSLRHTTGVGIIEGGGTVADVQDVLGHASIDTSRIYLESAREDIRLNNPAERFLDEMF